MKISFIIPGHLDIPTGGYRYDRAIIDCWRDAGHEVDVISLSGDFPLPNDEDLKRTFVQLASHVYGNVAVIDGLAGGASAHLMEVVSSHCPVVALIHHPLFLETGIDAKTAAYLKEEERAGLAHVSHVVTTSRFTQDQIATIFEFPKERITDILPGVKRSPAVKIGDQDKHDEVRLICVGSVTKRKGHEDLINALSSLTDMNWRLDCYGMTDVDAALYQHLKMQIENLELSDRILFHGSVSDEEIEQAYQSSDLFVLPSMYEGYGMVFAEAIVRGLPVIGTNAGAIPDTVPKGCGILVEPGDITSLKSALSELINNKAKRMAMKQNTIKAGPNFPSWQSSAARFAEILGKVS